MSKKKNNTVKTTISLKQLLILAAVFILTVCIFYFMPPTGNQTIDSIHDITVSKVDSKIEEIKEACLPESTKEEKSEIQDIQSSLPHPVSEEFTGFPDFFEIPLCPESSGDHKDHQIIHHQAYTICYRESYEQAEYSAYCIEEKELEKVAKRGDDFRPDDAVSTGSATLADYKGSGYDRGHLSPAADFAYSEETMSESFFMSNMSPQAGSLNRGIWKDLESNVRNWAKDYGKVYVISGPVLEKDASEYESIGKNKVSVPQYYYKVVLMPESKENDRNFFAMAFIFPNKKCEGTIWDYQVTVNEVEKRTNLDFFAQLPDSLEEKIESELTKINGK